jgi:glutamine synthetase adenylyltransferase
MPSVPALLRQVVKGPRVERLLESYRFLRRVEARARWLAGRAIDSLRVDHPQIPLLAELVDPGAGVEAVIERLREELRVARAAFCAVLEGGSIGFLGG